MNILSCCLFAAFSVTVGELPPCDYADTECSTNFPAPVDNHRGSFGHGNFDTEFSSPGFIYCEQ